MGACAADIINLGSFSLYPSCEKFVEEICVSMTPHAYMDTVSTAYVMRQRSNENDFLLTTNFILFTNQGYLLQNSSLWQLHSDGGVVSIVRSTAGRLLLVYLLARRLRSSGYYPK